MFQKDKIAENVQILRVPTGEQIGIEVEEEIEKVVLTKQKEQTQLIVRGSEC